MFNEACLAAVTPVKYERDWNDLEEAFTKSKISFASKILDGLLVIPTSALFELSPYVKI